MKEQTSKMVAALYAKKFGIKVTKVTSISDEPPSDENNFLLNPLFDQFQGFAYGNNGAKYLFFLMKNEDGWELQSTEIGSGL